MDLDHGDDAPSVAGRPGPPEEIAHARHFGATLPEHGLEHAVLVEIVAVGEEVCSLPGLGEHGAPEEVDEVVLDELVPGLRLSAHHQVRVRLRRHVGVPGVGPLLRRVIVASHQGGEAPAGRRVLLEPLDDVDEPLGEGSRSPRGRR